MKTRVQKRSHTSYRKKAAGATASSRSRISRWQLVLIACVALICFFQTSGYSFVYDDNSQIVMNPRIRSFTNLPLVFTEHFWAFSSVEKGNYYRPMLAVSFMLGYLFGGLSPAPYHWISIVMHILVSLSVFWVGWEYLGNQKVALFGALLFAAHPMHIESVAWIAGVTDVGCGLFYFVSLALYMYCRRTGKRGLLWLALAPISFFVALLYKEMAVTLPLMILAIDWTWGDASGLVRFKGSFRRLLPFVVVSLLYLGLRISVIGTFSRNMFAIPITLPDRLLTMLYFMGRYIMDLIVPAKQNVFQVFVPFSKLSPGDWGIPLLLLLGALGLFVYFFKRERKLAFLLLFVLLALVPVLNLGGIGQNMFTDRYLYIPSMGFCLLLPAIAQRYIQQRNAQSFLCSGIVLIFAVLTLAGHPTWRNNKTLYRETIAVSPDASLMRGNLATILYLEGSLAEAKREYQAAIDADLRCFLQWPPTRVRSYIGLSTIALDEGDLQGAEEYAELAHKELPASGEPLAMKGLILGRQGKFAEAEKILREAIQLQPDSILAHVNLSGCLMMLGDTESAEKELRTALDLDPMSVVSRNSLALLLSRTNRTSEAVSLLQRALSIDPKNEQSRRLLHELSKETAQ